MRKRERVLMVPSIPSTWEPTKIDHFLADSEVKLRGLLLEKMNDASELLDTSSGVIEELVSIYIKGDLYEASLEDLIKGAEYINRLCQKYGDLK